MKVSELVNEVNQEQELLQLCDKLCEDLLKVHLKQFPTLDWYGYRYKVYKRIPLGCPITQLATQFVIVL